jgi:hypothetical protein
VNRSSVGQADAPTSLIIDDFYRLLFPTGKPGIELDVSTFVDWVGAVVATLMPLILLTRAYLFAAERIHAGDTAVPVLAKGRPVSSKDYD